MRVLNKRLWPYQVAVDTGDIDVWSERREWLKVNVRIQDFYINESTYCFKNKYDCLMFTLRWA
jgi:hypothetical protein